jgi:hypothetical protein
MEKKKCKKCGIEKLFDDFHKDRYSSDGLKNKCKLCCKFYYTNNKEKILENSKKYYNNNVEIITKRHLEYNKKIFKNFKNKNEKKYKEILIKNNKRNKEYYSKNKNKVNEKNKLYYLKNKENARKYHQKYAKIKRNEDPMFKLKDNLRRRIRGFLKLKNMVKNNSTFNIIGCTPEFLKQHIEKQFTAEMNWENYGFFGWHIDHKIPLNNGKTEEDIIKLCYYTNLQPMWWSENLSKGKKII